MELFYQNNVSGTEFQEVKDLKHKNLGQYFPTMLAKITANKINKHKNIKRFFYKYFNFWPTIVKTYIEHAQAKDKYSEIFETKSEKRDKYYDEALMSIDLSKIEKITC